MPIKYDVSTYTGDGNGIIPFKHVFETMEFEYQGTLYKVSPIDTYSDKDLKDDTMVLVEFDEFKVGWTRLMGGDIKVTYFKKFN